MHIKKVSANPFFANERIVDVVYSVCLVGYLFLEKHNNL